MCLKFHEVGNEKEKIPAEAKKELQSVKHKLMKTEKGEEENKHGFSEIQPKLL